MRAAEPYEVVGDDRIYKLRIVDKLGMASVDSQVRVPYLDGAGGKVRVMLAEMD